MHKHTGSVQEFTIPSTTTYRLEVWGAQGTCLYVQTNYRNPFYGGKGGYSVGRISLKQNDILYVCVGQNGFNYDSIHDTEREGGYNIAREYGYNGGGCGHARGGGATHIALNINRGELKNYSNEKSAVLIVAGGGGGNEIVYNGEGGAGGGSVGGDGTGTFENFTVNNNGKGATDSAGGAGGASAGEEKGAGQNGSFGLGGSSVQAAGIYEKGAGGGGGWYGGGGSTAYAGTGGGGSGHLHSSIKNGSMQSGVHEGAGYALITWQQLP